MYTSYAGCKIVVMQAYETPTMHAPCVHVSNSLAVQVLSKLEHSTLAIRTSRLHHQVLGVLNGHNDTGSHLELLISLLQVDDVDAIVAALVHVALHL